MNAMIKEGRTNTNRNGLNKIIEKCKINAALMIAVAKCNTTSIEFNTISLSLSTNGEANQRMYVLVFFSIASNGV
jgi:hypothetical protein